MSPNQICRSRPSTYFNNTYEDNEQRANSDAKSGSGFASYPISCVLVGGNALLPGSRSHQPSVSEGTQRRIPSPMSNIRHYAFASNPVSSALLVLAIAYKKRVGWFHFAHDESEFIYLSEADLPRPWHRASRDSQKCSQRLYLSSFVGSGSS
jgi:hypothetical protein